jgi:spore coat polysaccharide biosynthesis protein SpsF (cytidylyltransferase family)
VKIGVLITARMGSTRLPDKHLRLVAGRPILAWLVERIEREFAADIAAGTLLPVLATGSYSRNARLAVLCEGNSVRMFYGDDDNVPRRHLQAAEALGLDAMLSVDGDDILCEPTAMREVHRLLAIGAQVAKTAGLPLGMNAWGYSRPALASALASADLGLLETGWGRIFEAVPAQVTELACPLADQVRATLDYDEDLVFFSRCISEIEGWGAMPVGALVTEIVRRGIDRENIGVNETYWANFAAGISREANK